MRRYSIAGSGTGSPRRWRATTGALDSAGRRRRRCALASGPMASIPSARASTPHLMPRGYQGARAVVGVGHDDGVRAVRGGAEGANRAAGDRDRERGSRSLRGAPVLLLVPVVPSRRGSRRQHVGMADPRGGSLPRAHPACRRTGLRSGRADRRFQSLRSPRRYAPTSARSRPDRPLPRFTDRRVPPSPLRSRVGCWTGSWATTVGSLAATVAQERSSANPHVVPNTTHAPRTARTRPAKGGHTPSET